MTTVHRIPLRISNAYLVKGERPVLVDTGSPGEGKRILRALERHGVQLADLSLILHTHGHSDHCGSTAELIERHPVPTAIHVADSHMPETGRNDRVTTHGLTAWIIRPFVDKPFPPFTPDLYVDSDTDLRAYGLNGRIRHTPGHTGGSITLALDHGEALIGDLIMGGWLGGYLFPSRPGMHYFHADREEVFESLRQLLALGCTTLHPGHGGPIHADDVRRRFRKDLERKPEPRRTDDPLADLLRG